MSTRNETQDRTRKGLARSKQRVEASTRSARMDDGTSVAE